MIHFKIAHICGLVTARSSLFHNTYKYNKSLGEKFYLHIRKVRFHNFNDLTNRLSFFFCFGCRNYSAGQSKSKACKNEAEEVKLDLEAELAEAKKQKEISDLKVKRGPKFKKNNKKRKTNEVSQDKVPSPEKKLKLDINRDLIKPKEARFIFPLDIIQLPFFEILEDPILKRMIETEKENAYKSQNWPIVPYFRNQLLVDLLEIIWPN